MSIKGLVFSLLQSYGAVVAFVDLLLEYIGLPLPGESMLLMLGFTIAGKSLVFPIILSTAGSFAGSMAAYFLGLRFGEKVLLKIGKPLHITKEKLEKTDRLLRKHEAATILTSRFIPGVRHLTPYMTGIAGVNIWKNALFNLIGSAVWCGLFIFLGTAAGKNWTAISRSAGLYTLMALALFLFLFIVWKYGRRFRFPILLFAGSVTALIGLTAELMENELSVFDSRIYGFLSELISEDRTDLMKLVSDMGSVFVLGGITVFLVLAFLKKPRFRIYGMMAAVNLASVSCLNVLFKSIFRRERPDILQLVQASGYSFPSGHSMVSAAFYGYLIYLCVRFIGKPWRQLFSGLLAALTLLIGVSRVYLGVHYASDVIGGFLAGFSWLLLFITCTEVFLSARNRKIAFE